MTEYDMRSPLPVGEARARLRAATANRRDPDGSGGRWVVSEPRDGGGIRLRVRNERLRNAWRPFADCGFYPDGAGCRLTADFRPPVPVVLVSALWLGFTGLLLVIDLVLMIVPGAPGRGHGAVAGVGVDLGLMLFGAGLAGAGFAAGRRDRDFLLDWLARELEATDPARN